MASELKNLLQAFTNYLVRKNEETDYYISLATTLINIQPASHSLYSGMTLNDSIFYMIGNYLWCYWDLQMSSTLYNSLGTGNIDPCTLITTNLTNIYYEHGSYGSATNEQRLNQISGIREQNISCVSGRSTGNAIPKTYHVRATPSGTSISIALTIDAIHSASSNHRVHCILPIVRSEWKNETGV